MERKEIRSLWDFSNPTLSEKRFREAIQNEPDTKTKAELMTQLARSLGLQRKFVEAHAILDTIPNEDNRVHALMLLERGRCYNSAGKTDKAKPLFKEAFDFCNEKNEENLAIDAIHMMAIVSEPQEALKLNYIGIKLAENAIEEQARNWLGSLLNNTAWTLHDSGEYEKALEIFIKGLEFREEKGQGRDIRIAKWCVARCLRSLGRIDEAMAILRVLETKEADGYVYEELGELLLILQKEIEASVYFAKAFELLSQDPTLQEREKPRLDRLLALSMV